MRLLLVDIQVTFAGAKVDNNTVMYFEEISIVCYTINFNVSYEIGNSQLHVYDRKLVFFI